MRISNSGKFAAWGLTRDLAIGYVCPAWQVQRETEVMALGIELLVRLHLAGFNVRRESHERIVLRAPRSTRLDAFFGRLGAAERAEGKSALLAVLP